MTTILLVILLVLAAFLVGCLAMRGDIAANATPVNRPPLSSDAPIDPNDAHQLGLLIGMTGGTITDAAVARAALERFAKDHGRPATTRDVGTLVGMMRAMR